MIEGFNHLTLSVEDLDRSVAFYRDLLGMRLTARWRQHPYAGMRFAEEMDS